MKSVLPFIAVLTLFFVASCEKQDQLPDKPRGNPLIGKYVGRETVYLAYPQSHPPKPTTYTKTIEVYEENGQMFAKDDSITVSLNSNGYYEHVYTGPPMEPYTYVIEIRNDSLFRHLNRYTGKLWTFSGEK